MPEDRSDHPEHGFEDGLRRQLEHRFELGTDGPRAIVVGVDGSTTSLNAAAYAIGLARRQHARLYCVYVRQASFAEMADATGVLTASVHQARDEIEAGMRHEFETHVKARGVNADLVFRDGDPYQELTRVAKEVGAEAVVVGASTRIGHRIAGSLAVRLVRAGRWPVTVVP